MCGSRKYPYPPWKVTGNSEGERGLNPEISKGRRGSQAVPFPDDYLTVAKTKKMQCSVLNLRDCLRCSEGSKESIQYLGMLKLLVKHFCHLTLSG